MKSLLLSDEDRRRLEEGFEERRIAYDEGLAKVMEALEREFRQRLRDIEAKRAAEQAAPSTPEVTSPAQG